MSKTKTHPNYFWLFHYNEYRDKDSCWAYFHQDDITKYKNGEYTKNDGRVVFGSSPKDCIEKAEKLFPNS